MIEPENGLFGFRLPTLSRISQLFLWHITRQNWGTDYWAYLGLGLIILALHLVMLATHPITETHGMRVIFATLSGDPMLDMLIGAVLTMLSFSSLALIPIAAARHSPRRRAIWRRRR